MRCQQLPPSVEHRRTRNSTNQSVIRVARSRQHNSCAAGLDRKGSDTDGSIAHGRECAHGVSQRQEVNLRKVPCTRVLRQPNAPARARDLHAVSGCIQRVNRDRRNPSSDKSIGCSAERCRTQRLPTCSEAPSRFDAQRFVMRRMVWGELCVRAGWAVPP